MQWDDDTNIFIVFRLRFNTEARCFFTKVLPTYHFNSQVGGGMCLRNVGGHVSGCIASNFRIHLGSYKSPLIVVT